MAADKILTLHPGAYGLNLRDDPNNLNAAELTDARNMRISARGSLVKRQGVAAWSTEDCPEAILRLGTFFPIGENPKLLAYTVGGNVYQTEDGAGWDTVQTGLSTSGSPEFCQVLDKVYICNGADPIVEWDGTTATNLPTVAVNDVQTVSITGTPTGGDFTLTFIDRQGANHTTAPIAFDASAADVQAALVLLDPFAPGDILCSGGDLPGSDVVVTFREGWGALELSTMTHTDSLTGGTAPAVHVTHTTTGASPTPVAEHLTVWKERLWASVERTVYWSASGDATDFSNTLNFVTFPDAGPITALAVNAQERDAIAGSVVSDSGDGVLVFTAHSTHRITDPSDNGNGIFSGGTNLVVDAAQGCITGRTVGYGRGKIWVLGSDGVYSTTGHDVLTLESKMIEPVFETGISASDIPLCDGVFWNGSYFLAYTSAQGTAHDRLLELAVDLPRNDEKQAPWMAHTIAAGSIVVLPDDANGLLLAADAQDGDEARVRLLFSGGSDVSDADTENDIQAVATTGMLDLGVPQPKGLRRLQAFGWGTFTISAITDRGTREAGVFSMPITNATWDPSKTWDPTEVWGGEQASPVASGLAYYTRHGRYLAFEIAEQSQNVGPGAHLLGRSASPESGGMKITALHVTFYATDSYG